MAFGYRKRNPGSGGSRPGAGRHPEISVETRYSIGQYCDERYAYECQEHNLREWFDQIVALWHAVERTSEEKDDMYYSKDDGPELTNQEIAVKYYFCYNTDYLYNDNAEFSFQLSDCKALIQEISDTVFGFKTELPEDYNLPRDKIRWTKTRILEEARRLLADPEQIEIDAGGASFSVSARFIESCWNQYLAWVRSRDIHKASRTGD